MPSPITDLERRGLLAQVSDREGLEAHLSGGTRTVYAGFDPTAPSLHHGHLVPLLVLRRMQLAGHKPIALVGGATGLIGDPSFREDERALNDEQTVAGWVDRLRGQVARFVDLDDSATGGAVVDNLEWTRPLDAISFLRDVGKHFSVNAMIQRDSVKSRLTREGVGISYTEFSYMLLQAYDFLELSRRYGCTVQVGGNDQWGNMVSGIDLIRRETGAEAYVATVPLVTKSDGSKFGKTAGGALWIDPSMTSPYSFYQFWLNTADADVVPFLGYFTFLDHDDIEHAGAQVRDNPGAREGQRTLAREVTRLVHGVTGLASAERITSALFEGELNALEQTDLEQLRQDGMSCTTIRGTEGLLTVLADSGLAQSRGAARKLVTSKGVRVNGVVVEDPEMSLSASTALHGRYHVVRRGKKSWHLAVHEAER